MASITYTIGEMADKIGKSVRTLQKWDKKGILVAFRTPTNRRYYTHLQLLEYLGLEASPKNKKIIAYCRVSSYNQKPDLKNQRIILEEFCINQGKSNVDFIEEIGGGLNFKRKKFLKIIQMIESEEVSEIILAHKDRFVRFGFELIEDMCQRHQVKLTLINSEKLSPEQEMVQDLMTIIHCFSSRLYGLRNYKKDLKKALKKSD